MPTLPLPHVKLHANVSLTEICIHLEHRPFFLYLLFFFFASNKQGEHSHKVCSDAFWFIWIFLCVKRNWTKWKMIQVYKLIIWFRPEQMNYRCKNAQCHKCTGLSRCTFTHCAASGYWLEGHDFKFWHHQSATFRPLSKTLNPQLLSCIWSQL